MAFLISLLKIKITVSLSLHPLFFLEKNIMWWSLDKHKVPSKYMTLIKNMYNNVVTSV